MVKSEKREEKKQAEIFVQITKHIFLTCQLLHFLINFIFIIYNLFLIIIYKQIFNEKIV